jgi:hypothetical protein
MVRKLPVDITEILFEKGFLPIWINDNNLCFYCFSYNMVSNGYLRDLTLTFPDGKTATVTVDLPTYRSAVEENGKILHV